MMEAMLPLLALGGAIYSWRNHMIECDEGIVMALERLGASMETTEGGVVTIALAIDAIDEIGRRVHQEAHLRRYLKKSEARVKIVEADMKGAREETNVQIARRMDADKLLAATREEAALEIARLTKLVAEMRDDLEQEEDHHVNYAAKWNLEKGAMEAELVRLRRRVGKKR